MLTGNLSEKADWQNIKLSVVWFSEEGPTRQDTCPFLQDGKAEIKVLKCPFPSRPKLWKYIPVEKPVLSFLGSRNWAGRPW